MNEHSLNAELAAAVRRVRQMAHAWSKQLPDTIRTATAVETLLHATERAAEILNRSEESPLASQSTTVGPEVDAEEMPSYSGEGAACRKCGHLGASTLYLEVGRCISSETAVGLNPNPRLHRTCDRCGYHWDERTMDNDPTAAATREGA